MSVFTSTGFPSTALNLIARAATQTHAPRSARPRRSVPTANAPDYSRFSHAEAAHAKRDCATCHVVASFAKPDITDFPDHPSCVECHRQQFFRGARPTICADCHTTVSPRTGARFPFPRADETPEFADQYPHANHIKTTSLIQFKKVIGEKSNIQATCLYCHKVNAAKLTIPTIQAAALRASVATQRATPTTSQAPIAPGSTAYVAPAGTFMTTPTSHATCFQCHWQKGVADHEQEPYATQCASCHRNTSTPHIVAATNAQTGSAAQGATAVPRASGNTGTPTPASVPSRLRIDPLVLTSLPRRNPFPLRYVPKFVHELDAHKKRVNDEGKEVAITCLTCHAAARKVTTLEALRSKESRAGLPTCSSSACHTATQGTAQLRLSVYRELRERAKDAKFDCALCHTPPLSLAADVPCSHYVAVFASATKEKKGTKGIEQLTPPRCADEMKKVTQ